MEPKQTHQMDVKSRINLSVVQVKLIQLSFSTETVLPLGLSLNLLDSLNLPNKC